MIPGPGQPPTGGAALAIGSRPVPAPWRGAIVLGLALCWLGGLGSVAALIGYGCWAGRAAGPTERRLLRAGLIIGVIGLLITVASFAALAGSSST